MASRRIVNGFCNHSRTALARAAVLGFGRRVGTWQSREQTAIAMPYYPCRRYAAPLETMGAREDRLSVQETRRLLKLVNVEEFKTKLLETGNHCVLYEEILDLCKQLGMATSDEEARQVVKVMDESGAVLIFRDKVFLRPEQIAEALAKVIPLPLAPEDDPRREELQRLEKEKVEIDKIARSQVRRLLWTGLMFFTFQSALFFRLTFWELSWDVMEPITFFVTSSGLLAGYFFFLITSRDPSYQDFMKTIFTSRQTKLMKKRNFDYDRYKELHMQRYPGWRPYSRKDDQGVHNPESSRSSASL